MPITKIEIKPGINKENTSYSNEGGYVDCDRVRFRSGYAEQIGGWANYSEGNAFVSTPKSMFCWSTSAGETLLAFGTTQKYYVEYNGQYRDITPARTTAPTSATLFATTSGTRYVVVTVTGHGASTGTWVTFTGSLAFNGVTVTGSYEIVEVLTTDTFTISVATTASGTGTNVGPLTISFKINAGQATYISISSGWGTNAWGAGGWGTATSSASVTSGTQIQMWTQTKFGDNLLMAPRESSPYYWAKDTTSFTPAVLLSTYANGVTKTTKAATFGGITSTITVPDSLNITSGAVISGTNIVAGTYVTTSYNGGNSVPISTPTTGASSGNYTFSHSGRSVPNSTYQVLSSEINQFTIAIGANPYSPTNFSTAFSPMLVRWSDQSNPAEWVPALTNQSGEQVLSSGSYLICGLSTRQEILIWSDSAIYSMQYIGTPFIFNFQLLMDNISIASPNAAITVNNITYWMGTDKFYVYSGQVQTLPCTLRHWVFNNLNGSQLFQVVCGSNPAYNEVWWFYPSSGSNVCDTYVVYNYLENIWYPGTMMRSAWLSTPLKPYPLSAFGVQTTYLSAAITSSDITIPVINARSYPSSGVLMIDSELIYYAGNDGLNFTGCTRGYNSTTAASHVKYTVVSYYAPNSIINQEFGVDDMSMGVDMPMSLNSHIETGDFDIADGHTFAFVTRILPDLSFEGSTAGTPSVTLIVKPRVDSGSAYTTGVDEPTVENTVKAPVAPNTFPVEQYTGQVYTRVRGRQMAFRVESTSVGVAWQLGSMRFDIRSDGRRA